MGALFSQGDIGVWASNAERDAVLDWFAEHRCEVGDPRLAFCKSEDNRWTGCGILLGNLIPPGEVFELTEQERAEAAEELGPDVASLLGIIARITRGEWRHRADSREAVQWRNK